MLRKFALGGFALAMALGMGAANSADLKIGSRNEVVMDPHYAWSASNLQFYWQYLGYLVKQGPHNEALPGLAASFAPVSDTVWEFKLRPGMHFDDGKPVTAADVIASYQRARTLPNAIGSYAGLFSGVTEMKAPDDLTVQLVTEKPYPTLPVAMTQIAVLPKSVAESATQADFISGKADIGAAQYKFASYKPGESLVVTRNDQYYGPKARWDKVTFRFITDDAARVAALLAGDVDVADGIPTGDVERIKKDGRFTMHVGPSDRVVFLAVDSERDVTPDVTGNDSKPLTKNPFKDVRVRKAMSLAINREAIRDRIMNGLSFPSNQLVTKGVGGYADDIPPARYDVAEAKRLMKEAGWEDGFKLTLRCTNGRLVNDARICQTLGQMFGRINIKTEVALAPTAVFWAQMTKHDGPRGSVAMLSWSSAGSGEAIDLLQNVIHTYDPAKKLGTWNLTHYSNPEVDKLIDEARVTVDKDKRLALERKATQLAMADVAVIPMHAQSVAVATRKGMDFTPYFNESTIADTVRPAGK
ncbi:Solute-binding protein family 5 domain-containing protein [Bordetella sputigena]|uniref:ABC transporter substrate-binding protein n=1 Tax=Bordetella sputigena TaxID=1416810 RepID=UPI0039EDF5B6